MEGGGHVPPLKSAPGLLPCTRTSRITWVTSSQISFTDPINVNYSLIINVQVSYDCISSTFMHRIPCCIIKQVTKTSLTSYEPIFLTSKESMQS